MNTIRRRTTTLRSPRLARKERRRTKQRVIFLTLLGSMLAGGLLYTFNTPRFLLSQVAVDGVDEATANEVKTVAAHTLSGTYLGLISRAHPFFYPKSEMVGQVLAAFPQFARIAVSREGLAALRVAVTPRTPVALWCAEGKGCAYLDEESVIFAEAPPGSERLYYQLSGKAIDSERLKALLAFFGQLENKGLVPLQANFTETGSVVVTLHSGARLFIHESEGYATALKRLQVLLRESGLIPRQGMTEELAVDYIDLRYGNKVYFKAR